MATQTLPPELATSAFRKCFTTCLCVRTAEDGQEGVDPHDHHCRERKHRLAMPVRGCLACQPLAQRLPESAVFMPGEWPPPGTEPEWGCDGESQGRQGKSLLLHGSVDLNRNSRHQAGAGPFTPPRAEPGLCEPGALAASLAPAGGRDAAPGHAVVCFASSEPMSLSTSSVERELDLGISALPWKEGTLKVPLLRHLPECPVHGWR